ncbi:MAG TPA: hypothetical protein VFQ53_06310 [Kofleriaceae bacterium]|nr:hypothetical protein [Kofleriaceae bacterium]
MRRALPLLLVIPTAARADTEQAVSVGVGYATFSVPGEAEDPEMAPPTLSPYGGIALGVTYERSVGTDVVLRGELLGGSFYGGAQKDQSNFSYAALGDAGVALRFDVFQYVPYAFVGLGGVLSGGGPIDRGIDYALVAGAGLDVLRSRERSWGGELRLASFAGDVTVFTVGVRGTARWGFF